VSAVAAGAPGGRGAPGRGGRPLRIFLGAFGDPGHAFPMLALGERLVDRGHTVALQTWRRWREPSEAAGMAFLAAPEYQVFPTRERPMTPYAAAVRAARETVPAVEAFRPDVAVADILTAAPALAAELRGVPVATLVPHVHPWPPPGAPPFSIGARRPRTRAGALAWRAFDPAVAHGLEVGRRQYNEARRRLGLGPLPFRHPALSRSLTLVGTLPHLEYPRRWPAWLRVVGPLMWEPPGEAADPPPGDGPVVLLAPSTSQDPEERLLRAALAGLNEAPVRVLASANGRDPGSFAAPGNARVVPWLSYAKTMPACDLVVSHGGHGTVARALWAGCAMVICPAAGDMAENAARIDWAGVGVRLPRRLLSPRAVRLAVERALADGRLRARARAVAAWAGAHDGPATAAREIEAWAWRGATARGGA
jgi:UDP:flavonoid glycosyltransferase YjiC (YdhE family)